MSTATKRFEECDIDGPFDAVIGSSILNHLDVAAALSLILRLLKPAVGSVSRSRIISYSQVFLERKLRFLPVFQYTSPDETAFVRRSFAPRLRAAGFIDASIVPFDWLHPRVPPKPLAPFRNLERSSNARTSCASSRARRPQ